jgi:hypothetical protein
MKEQKKILKQRDELKEKKMKANMQKSKNKQL